MDGNRRDEQGASEAAATDAEGENPAGENPAGDAGRSEVAIRALLSRHPKASVAAFGDGTVPDPIPVPGWVRARPDQALDVITTPDVVDSADRAAFASLWGLARSRGAVAGPVRLGDTEGNLYLFDLRATRQAMIAVFVEGSTEDHDVLVAEVATPPPRFALVSKDERAMIQWADPTLAQILGWEASELLGRSMTELVHPDDHERALAAWVDMLGSPGPAYRIRLRHRHRDGSWVWMEVTNHNRLADPEHGDVLAEMLDVSEEMAAHEAVRAREQLLAQVTDTVPMGLFHMDLKGRLLFVNRPLEHITGVPAATTLDEQLSGVVKADRPQLAEALLSASDGTDVDLELDITDPRSPTRHCALRLRSLVDDSGSVVGVTGCLEDVTDLARARRELEIRAASDPLTGCLNRAATLRTLNRLLELAAGSGDQRGTAVVFADLDGLKAVNDRFGHAAGDRLLVEVTARIRSSIRSGDVVGRFGGDEFVVVCPEVPSTSSALRIAHDVARQLHQPLTLEDAGPVSVRASMGVAWAESGKVSARDLIDQADGAMYESKRQGRGEPVLSDTLHT